MPSFPLALPLMMAEPSEAGMPQFDPALFPGQIFWLLIIFGLFWFLMARVGLPKVERVLEEREERLSGDLDAAERMGREAATVETAYEGRLAEARTAAQKVGAETRDKVAAKLAAAQANAEARLADRLAQAEQEIAAARNVALGQVEGVAVEAARELVLKLAADADTSTVAARVSGALKSEGAAGS